MHTKTKPGPERLAAHIAKLAHGSVDKRLVFNYRGELLHLFVVLVVSDGLAGKPAGCCKDCHGKDSSNDPLSYALLFLFIS